MDGGWDVEAELRVTVVGVGLCPKDENGGKFLASATATYISAIATMMPPIWRIICQPTAPTFSRETTFLPVSAKNLKTALAFCGRDIIKSTKRQRHSGKNKIAGPIK